MADNARSGRANGQRGRVLASIRKREGVGQDHLARAMGLTQPALSFMEGEVYGGVPRGFASRYLDAIAAVREGRAGEHYRRCGCHLCPDCKHGPIPADFKACGRLGCARRAVLG